MTDDSLSWYAAKILKSKPVVTKYIASLGIETFVPTSKGKPILGSLVFLRAAEEDVLRLKYDWFSQVAVYRDAERQKPQAIPDREMDNFRRVLQVREQEIIPIEIRDPQFLVGEKVRVTDGPLKGAEGIIKRIKGDRRLVVSITGVAAIATSFVPPSMLEKVEPQAPENLK